MLQSWDFNIEIYKAIVRWQEDNPDGGVNAAAVWWLQHNSAIWGDWVTGESAAAIQAALDAGEIPEGWPAE